MGIYWYLCLCNDYYSVYKTTTVLISRGQFVMRHVYIMYILYFTIFLLLKASKILSSSFKQENSLKLCQATWTTHSYSEKVMTYYKLTARNQYSCRLSTNHYTSINTNKYTYLLNQKYIYHQLLCYVVST